MLGIIGACQYTTEGKLLFPVQGRQLGIGVPMVLGIGLNMVLVEGVTMVLGIGG